MKKTKLGEFEELVLLAVAVLQENAYGVEIKRELFDLGIWRSYQKKGR